MVIEHEKRQIHFGWMSSYPMDYSIIHSGKSIRSFLYTICRDYIPISFSYDSLK